MSGISEERLAEIERDFAGSLSEMKGTPQHCCHLLIAEIRRLRAENASLQNEISIAKDAWLAHLRETNAWQEHLSARLTELSKTLVERGVIDP